jgi:hypothetical protein
VEFAKASALRPRIVGEALQGIAQDPEVMEALFQVLEAQKLAEGNARLTLLPDGNGAQGVLPQLLAAQSIPQKG